MNGDAVEILNRTGTGREPPHVHEGAEAESHRHVHQARAQLRRDGARAGVPVRGVPEGLVEGLQEDRADRRVQDPIVHSDRDCHYRWPSWISICREKWLVRSMSRKGCSPDNARAEGLFGRLKVEFFLGRDWQG